MCLFTSPSSRYTVYDREDLLLPPRPVSKYHSRPQSATYYTVRRPEVAFVRYVSPVPYQQRYVARQPTRLYERYRNSSRSYSIRSKTNSDASAPKHRFTMSSLRGIQQPELSKKLYKLIKTENHAIGAYESAGRETQSIATQLSEWGESTEDDGVSDISDKLAVLLSEIAEQEEVFSQNLEESRGVLKQIRNTESSVHPSRTNKIKIQDEIQKLKYKEPESPKLVVLEQELVRAEAQSLVAEAQLTNVTRQKFKEAYDLHTAAVIERAEKQILLAQHARRLLSLLDDTPTVPGEERAPFAHSDEARDVLNDAEADLRAWAPRLEAIPTTADSMGSNAMPLAPAEPPLVAEDAPKAAVVPDKLAAEDQRTAEAPVAAA